MKRARILPVLTVALLAVAALAVGAACGGDEAPRQPSGVSTATPGAREATATPTATRTAPPAPSPAGERTPLPRPDADPTQFEVGLAAAASEDPRVVAGALAFLAGECSDEREALGQYAEQTWRILNEQRGIRVPVVAIVNRVIAALPLDGRTVACESLFASVVTELSRP